jgi:hypothetical protein
VNVIHFPIQAVWQSTVREIPAQEVEVVGVHSHSFLGGFFLFIERLL